MATQGLRLPPPGSPSKEQNQAIGFGDLTVHDLTIGQTPISGPSGLTNGYQVRYWVGAHGPFIEQYTPDQYTPDQVKADIQAEVNSISAIQASTAVPAAAGAAGPPAMAQARESAAQNPGGAAANQVRIGGVEIGYFPNDAAAIAFAQAHIPGSTFVPGGTSVSLRPGQFTINRESQNGSGYNYSATFAQTVNQPIPQFYVAPPNASSYSSGAGS